MAVHSSLLIQTASPDRSVALALEHADSITVDLTCGPATPEESRRWAVEIVGRSRQIGRQLRVWVQINALETGLADADLAAVLGARLDGIVLPCRSGEDVQHLGTKLAVREAELGIADGSTRITAIAGVDAAALFRMDSYAGSSPRLTALAWDAEQLAGAFGIKGDVSDRDQPPPLDLARTLTIVAARAAGVAAIDTACRLSGDALEANCRKARRDGFAGKFATSIDQIAVIRAVFGEGHGD